MRRMIAQWIPPIISRIIKRVWTRGVYFEGWYGSWQSAAIKCSGYDQEHIVQKVLDSTLLVSQGRATFERDSVLFDEIQYSWPLLTALMWVAAQNRGELRVLDFGGALGTSYFQNKKFFKNLKVIEWSIVEQESYIKLGQRYLQDDTLKFYKSIADQTRELKSNVILLSSVMQYLPNPYQVLVELLGVCPHAIIFDRTSFINSGNEDRIRIQNVPKEIYEARYPCWFLSKPKLCKYLIDHGYKLLEDFDSGENLDKFGTWGGMIFIRDCND